MPTAFKSLKGQLLLDGGSLGGSFFHRSVVLICQHDREGAFGLVLNRPAGSKLGDMLVADLPDALRERPVYLGGPVQPSALSYLHNSPRLTEANVIPNVVLGHALESLVELCLAAESSHLTRVFAGYSGWSPGQLEQEMKRKAWLTHPATVHLVFEVEPTSLWRHILLRKGSDYRLLADAPEDLAWN